MNFDVAWSTAAENELTALWNDPTLRPLVAAASQALDERLEQNAADEGESRTQGARITFEPPLGMLFWVNEQAQRVLVLHVWAFEM
ncbi:MAG TPA: hypothetical protein VM529_25445 [Gemmata sp.]|nr:hypothetical protein [Gemmata sp.]